MKHTNGIALQTPDGAHVGFCLAAPSFQGESGDCVFMLLPTAADGIDTKLGHLLSQLKVDGEHQWTKTDEDVYVLDSSGSRVFTVLASGGVLDADGTEVGVAIPLPERK